MAPPVLIRWSPFAGEVHAQNVADAAASTRASSYLIASYAAATSLVMAVAFAAERLTYAAGIQAVPSLLAALQLPAPPGGVFSDAPPVFGVCKFAPSDLEWPKDDGGSFTARRAAAAVYFATQRAIRGLLLHGVRTAKPFSVPTLDNRAASAPGLPPAQLELGIDTLVGGQLARVSHWQSTVGLGASPDLAPTALQWDELVELVACHKYANAVAPGVLGGLSVTLPPELEESARAEAGGKLKALGVGSLALGGLFLARGLGGR